jgi:sodium/hydrogen antiporter
MDLLLPLGVVAGALVATSLAAGLVERAAVSFPILFLGLGLVLGPGVTDTTSIALDDPALMLIAVATLSLVLFLDATNLDVDGLRNDWWIPALTLGPGTLLTIGLVAAAAVLLFGLTWPMALIAGAALASTDAVTLRDVLRDRRLPIGLRRSLAVEAGTNDLLVLPILLILVALATGEAGGIVGWAWFAVQLLVIGPAAGALVGVGGALLMGRVDRRTPIRLEYQSLYGIGLVFAAYVAGELVGGSGFLAAFAAGIAVSRSNATLCDCFLDLGQVLAEVLLLAAFVVFGVVLSDRLGSVGWVAGLGFALFVLVIARPLAVGGVLSVSRTALSPRAIALMAWSGPRGLASLLLALLAVQAGVPGGETVFAIVGMVVTVSVFVHGSTSTPLAGLYARRDRGQVLPEDRATSATDALRDADPQHAPRIEVDDLVERLQGPDAPWVVDVRSPAARRQDPTIIPGSRWVPPDEAAVWIEAVAGDDAPPSLAVWCTCANEATAARIATLARAHGIEAWAVRGGRQAWQDAGHPVAVVEVTSTPGP